MRTMRPVCVRKTLLQGCAVLFLLAETGCVKPAVQSVETGEWLQMIIDRAELESSLPDDPHFGKIRQDSPYYGAVETALAWQIIDPSDLINPQEPLTNEWAAYTLSNLLALPEEGDHPFIRDISDSPFQSEINNVISLGLMKTDRNGCFNPKALSEREEVTACLSAAISILNNRPVKNGISHVVWNEEQIIDDPVVIAYDSRKQEVILPLDTEIERGQLIRFSDKGKTIVMEVQEYAESDETLIAKLCPPNPAGLIRDCEIEQSFDVNFEDAELEDLTETGALNSIEPMGYFPKQIVKSIHGYRITVKKEAGGIHAGIVRELPFHAKAEAELILSSLKPSFVWKMKDRQLEHGYFKIGFSSSESLSVGSEYEKQKNTGFENATATEWLRGVIAGWNADHQLTEVELPICRIRIPVPQAQMFQIVTELNLKLSADGKAQLFFKQNYGLGMEIRNGQVRSFCDGDATSQLRFESAASIGGDVLIGLMMEQMRLMDAGCRIGAKTELKSTVHLYGRDGTHRTAGSELPGDYLNHMAAGNPDVAVCHDIKSGLYATAVLNSEKTAAHRLGFTGTLDLMKLSDSPAHTGFTHVEEGQSVTHCTRKDRVFAESAGEAVESDQLKIRSYSFLMRTGETRALEITGIPRGYDADELIYQVEDPSVASVSGAGIVSARNEGSTIVEIRTPDRKFRIQCSISVRKGEP